MKKSILIIVLFLIGTVTGKAQRIASGTNSWSSYFLCGVPGSPKSCGNNDYGQLGDGTSGTDRHLPVYVSGLSGITEMAPGGFHAIFLKNDGTVWACGLNDHGQLGDGTNTERHTPFQIMSGVSAIAAGHSHSLFLKSNGTVWACGWNNFGQLGDGTTTDKLNPVQISGLSGVIAMSAGSGHSLFLKNDGTVWACGSNSIGQLGDGTNFDRTSPVQVVGISNVTAIAAGATHSLFRKSDGSAWSCGFNGKGQLGIGSYTNMNTPVQVYGLSSGITAVAAGGGHSLFLKNDGSVVACGNNDDGQLGDGSMLINRQTPVSVGGLSNITSIAAGYFHSLFLKNDDTTWSCGWNNSGQLADGNTEDKSTPERIYANGNPCSNVSIAEAEFNDFHIYPNPTSGVLHISASKQIDFEIFNELGAIVRVGRITNSGVVDLGNYAPGIFGFRMFNEVDEPIFRKIVLTD